MSAVALASCGSGDGAGSTTTTLAATTTTLTAATTTLPSVSSTTVPPASTTTESPTTSTEAGDLPGEPIEFGPARGDIVAVVGVAHDDVLNLRALPGASQPVLEEIPPLYDGLIAQGHTRDLGTGFWIEVEYEGTEGWVSFRYIAFLGATTDETASIIDNLGETPAARTMAQLGLTVAESLASPADPKSEIVLTAAPTTGDLGEVTYDVVGLGDDAVRGVRVHVFGQPQGEEFVLKTVEMTTLCGRGVTDDGFCI
jgi:hypothetical protein